ncbi:MAG: hypothetical protein HYR55_17985 [Acidobacteria bacterium]|nr:hypothetical protein [Acidobacteriota bacterium]MBI3655435.1 hypothetical protein [Acidobacteriota bacterium]
MVSVNPVNSYVTFNLEVPFADAVSFISKQRNPTQIAIREAYRCYTLQLAPLATAIGLEKIRPNFNARTCCNGLNLLDRADDIKFNSLILSNLRVTSSQLL